MKVYTEEDWKHDHRLKVQVGQAVSDTIFYDLLECLPPTYFDGKVFQVGEPETYDEDGNYVYATYRLREKQWVFDGYEKAIS